MGAWQYTVYEKKILLSKLLIDIFHGKLCDKGKDLHLHNWLWSIFYGLILDQDRGEACWKRRSVVSTTESPIDSR